MDSSSCYRRTRLIDTSCYWPLAETKYRNKGYEATGPQPLVSRGAVTMRIAEKKPEFELVVFFSKSDRRPDQFLRVRSNIFLLINLT